MVRKKSEKSPKISPKVSHRVTATRHLIVSISLTFANPRWKKLA